MAERIEMSFVTSTLVGPMKKVLGGGGHWRHLANTCPQERLRSTVMSVGASVCLSDRISTPEPHARSLPFFTKLFVRVAYVRGSVLLWHVDDRPHRLSARTG